MVSQRQLAAYLKLSPGTVSRALRNLPGTDVQTQAAVMEAAAKLGYRMPARTGEQQLRGLGLAQQTKLMGVLISQGGVAGPPGSIFTRFLHGAAEAARELDVSLQVDCVAGERADQIHQPNNQSSALRSGLAKGLILAGLFPPEVAESLALQQPCVRLNDRRIKVDNIAQDDLQAADDLVDHLVELKHNKIAFLMPQSDLDYTFGSARLAGYLEAMIVRGLPMNQQWWLGVGESAADDGAALLARAERLTREGVTAWMCVNDVWGYRLLEHFRAVGIRVPKDVSVVGFDSMPAPSGLEKLTSVEWPFEDMGAACVRRLYRRLQNPLMAVSQSVFSGKVLVGATTAARA